MSESNGSHDLLTETPLPLAELLKLVAHKYKVKRHWNTWFQWQRKERDKDSGEYLYGAKRWDGKHVVLESTYIGNVIHSTEAAWLRFQAAQNEGRE